MVEESIKMVGGSIKIKGSIKIEGSIKMVGGGIQMVG